MQPQLTAAELEALDVMLNGTDADAEGKSDLVARPSSDVITSRRGGNRQARSARHTDTRGWFLGDSALPLGRKGSEALRDHIADQCSDAWLVKAEFEPFEVVLDRPPADTED